MSEKKRADALLQKCYNEYRIRLFNYCLSRLDSREAADDCVQETFIVFYNKLLDGKKFENPRAFLYRTADNFVKRQKQKDAVELKRNVPLDEAADVGVTDEYLSRLDLIDWLFLMQCSFFHKNMHLQKCHTFGMHIVKVRWGFTRYLMQQGIYISQRCKEE